MPLKHRDIDIELEIARISIRELKEMYGLKDSAMRYLLNGKNRSHVK